MPCVLTSEDAINEISNEVNAIFEQCETLLLDTIKSETKALRYVLDTRARKRMCRLTIKWSDGRTDDASRTTRKEACSYCQVHGWRMKIKCCQ